ncbi:hypothetical protein SAMN05421761_104210 [Belliella pelovolcani]|uniref:Uncharacterized protein n=1 Tax=Belliella pelovolcani TaxID=529505 RepID=A0A1N7LYB6_9BACT|nr:hypothetical protein SAMN05421761_104210 [Belliella pelovolcani]
MTQDYEPNRNQKIWGLSDGYFSSNETYFIHKDGRADLLYA